MSMKKYKLVRFADRTINTKGCEIVCDLMETPHRMPGFEVHDYLLLLFIVQGAGVHYINGEKNVVAPFQIHIVFPGQPHRWDFDPCCIVHRLIIGTTALQRGVGGFEFKNIGGDYNSSAQLIKDDFFKLLSELQLLSMELSRKPIVSELIDLRCKIVLYLVKVHNRAAFSLSKKPRSAIIYNFQMLVESNLNKQTSVSFYARELGVTANYLTILCKKILKTSALGFIHQRRLIKAKKLIQDVDVPIKEIAYELGFNEYSHFSTFFKAKMGVSPKQYRGTLCVEDQ